MVIYYYNPITNNEKLYSSERFLTTSIVGVRSGRGDLGMVAKCSLLKYLVRHVIRTYVPLHTRE